MAFTISFVTIVVRARLAGMDESLEEAAQDLGANPVTTFVRVTLPLIFPGVMAGALLAFTLSFDDFVITFFVSGVGSSTLPLKIYSMIKFGVTPVINALSTVVLVATIALIFGGSRLLVRKGELLESCPRHPSEIRTVARAHPRADRTRATDVRPLTPQVPRALRKVRNLPLRRRTDELDDEVGRRVPGVRRTRGGLDDR